MIPIAFELHMQQMDSSLDEVVVDETQEHHVAKLFSNAAIAVAADDAAVGLERLRKLGNRAVTNWRPPDASKSNPWARPDSDALAKADEASADLVKRFAVSTRKAALVGWIKSRLAVGETIESLATYAAVHDETTARLIREVGAEL